MSKKSIIIMKNLQKSTPKNLANLDTSRPFANGIRLMDVQYLISNRVSVYYGDLVDHGFWDRLDIMVGAYTDGLNILTRQDGFLYKYNYPDKTFKVFDNNNVLVLRRNNIQSLADMKIDFTIFNSHQFEIYLTPEEGSKIYPFLIPAKMKPKKFDMFVYTDLRGVCNIYELGKYEVVPNNFAQKYLAYFPNRYTFMYDPKKPEIVPPPIVEVEKVYTYYQYRTAFHTSFLYKINLASSNPNQWKYCVYDFYVEGDFKKDKKFKARAYRPIFDLPETGNGLYPMLNPIKRVGETQNNRPIYEPWLIYGFFNNVSRISHDDLDKYDLWLLDLSPNYGR